MKDRKILRDYKYDQFGNRIKKVEKGKKIVYNYNNLNQLISTRDQQGNEQN